MFAIYPCFWSKCIYDNFKPLKYLSSKWKKVWLSTHAKRVIDLRFFWLSGEMSVYFGTVKRGQFLGCLRLFYTTFTRLSSSLKILFTTPVLGQFCLHSCGLKWLLWSLCLFTLLTLFICNKLRIQLKHIKLKLSWN